LISNILWADVTFSWFASGHAFWAVRLSKIFRKKSIVVVGGYEVARVPEIGYGAVIDPRGKSYVEKIKYVLKNADSVLTVDESLKIDAIKNFNIDGTNIQTVPTGYDHEKFKPRGRKENLVITVGYIKNDTIKRKGLETFIKAAYYVPDAKFVLIGKFMDTSIEDLKRLAPKNVEFAGFVSDESLVQCYQRAKVYCQLSLYEGLPNALCEAMLCECVPVGTRVCGIPSAIGETGFYVPCCDPKATAEAVKLALKAEGKDARTRIKNMFSLERREKEIKKIIVDLVEPTSCS
jgi:glycosyltransferase involved in cell wall biosynthesis